MQSPVQDKTKLYSHRLNAWFFALAFAVYFMPQSYAVANSAYKLWQGLVAAVSLLAVLLYLSYRKVEVQWLCFALFFFFCYPLSSLLANSDGSTMSIGFAAVKGIGFVSLVAYGLEEDDRACIGGFAAAGLFMCLVNFGSYLEYRDVVGGMKAGEVSFQGTVTSQHWFFLSHDNGTLFYYLPTIAALLFYSLRFNSRIMPVAVAFTVLAVYMYVDLQSMTAATVILAFCLAAFFLIAIGGVKNGKEIRFPSYRKMLGTVFLGTIAIAFVLSSDFVQDVIALYGKTGSMNARAVIWSRALEYIRESPLLGCGLNDSYTDISRLTYNHAHNIALQILYQGGLVSLLLFLSGCLYLGTGKSSYSDKPETHVVAIAAAAILVAGSFDFYINYVPQLFPFLLLGHLSEPLGQRDAAPERGMATGGSVLAYAPLSNGAACKPWGANRG